MTTTSSTNPVDDYAQRVVLGTVPAGKYHRLACARHLRDRARENTEGFPFRFVWEARHLSGKLRQCAVRFLEFARQAKHYKGKRWAGKHFEPTESQVFRLGSIFGWRHVETGYRRFTTAYNELPRKNGKSFEAAIVLVYCAFFEGEPGAEGYCIATKEKQAKIVFGDAKRLVTSTPALVSRIKVNAANLNRARTDSKAEPLGSDSDTTDGLNPYVIVTDEFHAMKTRDLVDVMESATGARDSFLHFQITTAGDDPVSPCGDQHDYCCQILDGVIEDEATESTFVFIAHADPGDDWLAESTWRKANPHYGLSVNPVDIRKLALKAKNMPSAAAEFQQKRLNIWVNSHEPWLSMDGWRAGQPTTPLSRQAFIESLRGRRCCVGVDLSSKLDLTAVVAVFPPIDDETAWRYLLYAFTPKETLKQRARRDRAPYQVWADQGHLLLTPGNRIEHKAIRAALNDEIREAFDVDLVGFDPWNIGSMTEDLEDDGWDRDQLIEIPQNYQHMSDPSKEFEADVVDGLVDANGNPVFGWAASNAVVQRDGKDNIQPIKKHSRGRIDPIVAGIMGRKLAALDREATPADDPDLVIA